MRKGSAARVAIMTTWEYMTAPIMIHATKQILDNFGSEGWELVAILPGVQQATTPDAAVNAPQQTNPIAYFKRPRES